MVGRYAGDDGEGEQVQGIDAKDARGEQSTPVDAMIFRQDPVDEEKAGDHEEQADARLAEIVEVILRRAEPPPGRAELVGNYEVVDKYHQGKVASQAIDMPEALGGTGLEAEVLDPADEQRQHEADAEGEQGDLQIVQVYHRQLARTPVHRRHHRTDGP